MTRKYDIKQIDRIVEELDLSRGQRRLLHDEISGQNYTLEEITEIAREIKRLYPNQQWVDQMAQDVLNLQAEVIQALVGKPCWYVSCGGAASSSFQLAFGAKVPRRQPLRNQNHSEEYRQFEGEANLLVWCTWRLDDPASPLSSSDDTEDNNRTALTRLTGCRVVDVKIETPGWDLVIHFSGGLKLRVFCDHLPGDPSFTGNWELWQPDQVIAIGAGSVCEVEARVN